MEKNKTSSTDSLVFYLESLIRQKMYLANTLDEEINGLMRRIERLKKHAQ